MKGCLRFNGLGPHLIKAGELKRFVAGKKLRKEMNEYCSNLRENLGVVTWYVLFRRQQHKLYVLISFRHYPSYLVTDCHISIL